MYFFLFFRTYNLQEYNISLTISLFPFLKKELILYMKKIFLQGGLK